MAPFLVFAGALLVAVLVSGRAQTSLLSTAALFLVVGVVAGASGAFPPPAHIEVRHLAEIALVVSLFTDGGKVCFKDVRRAPHLPTRALLLGLPLTLVATALAARLILELPWLEALLLGAALSPTDPVIAASFVGSGRVPGRLRRLLNVESGLNDGLAVPIVLSLIGALGGSAPAPLVLVAKVIGGAALGVAIPVSAVWLYRRESFGASKSYKPIFSLSVLLLVWGAAHAISANEFVASFVSGVVLANVSAKAREHWEPLGEPLMETLKLGAILFFGVQISAEPFRDVGWAGVAFAAAALFVARPLALLTSLLGSHLERREMLAAAWFGPRGFASVMFGLIIVDSAVPEATKIFHAVAMVVGASVLLHSSTDSLVVRLLARRDGEPLTPSHA